MKLPYEREYYFWKKNYDALCVNMRLVPRRFGNSLDLKQYILMQCVLMSKLRESKMSDPVYQYVSKIIV